MSLNVFKYCTGLKLLGSFMILVVLAIVGVTYYAIVVCTYGPDLLLGGWKSAVSTLVLILFHGLLAMLLWCYFSTVLSDPGSVPEDWSPYASHQYDVEAAEKVPRVTERISKERLRPQQAERTALLGSVAAEEVRGSGDLQKNEAEDQRPLAAPEEAQPGSFQDGGGVTAREHQRHPPADVDASSSGALLDQSTSLSRDLERSPPQHVEVRRCKKCLQYKPPRTHHCSVCRRCILKMDHHCVWVVNCVGARNYKSFLLFLAYTFLESFLVCVALLPRFIDFFSMNLEGDAQEPGKLAAIFLSFVLNFAFTLSLLGFLAMHVSLVLHNTTTIEAFEKSKVGSRWKWDLGRKQNFEQVFGRDRWFWVLPLYSPEDLKGMPELSGLNYPSKSEPPVPRDLAAANALSLD